MPLCNSPVVGSRAMRRAVIFIALIAAACGRESTQRSTMPGVSKEPVSVRGWIADVDPQSGTGVYRTVETEAARKAEAFQAMNVWVDNAPYVSGAIAPNGAFVLLDVPPGNVTVSFALPPAIPVAHLTLSSIPGNADVLIPGLIIKRDGSVTVEDPKQLKIRVATKPPSATAKVAGFPAPIVQVPVNALTDRHDYLEPPTQMTPVAKVR
jgi:hypothetical protein